MCRLIFLKISFDQNFVTKLTSLIKTLNTTVTTHTTITSTTLKTTDYLFKKWENNRVKPSVAGPIKLFLVFHVNISLFFFIMLSTYCNNGFPIIVLCYCFLMSIVILWLGSLNHRSYCKSFNFFGNVRCELAITLSYPLEIIGHLTYSI